MRSGCSFPDVAMLVLGLALAVPAALADSGLPGGVNFPDKSCNEIFHRYLSCFEGANLKKCVMKLGAKICREEQGRAVGDLATAWAFQTSFNKPGCFPEMRAMLTKNISVYQKAWHCSPF